jgi:hypothetical protein
MYSLFESEESPHRDTRDIVGPFAGTAHRLDVLGRTTELDRLIYQSTVHRSRSFEGFICTLQRRFRHELQSRLGRPTLGIAHRKTRMLLA